MSELFDKFDQDEHQAYLAEKKAPTAARDDAIEVVGNNHPAWAARFRLAVLHVASQRTQFTTDDVIAFAPTLEGCPEKRVFGSVLMTMCRQGVLEPLGYTQSNRKASHNRPKRLWRMKT